ncbi:parkin coregulated gene protein [Cyprinodon tularosa]|uniref:parkin coregulated gene protein n=1 Tax=Cyprinodon tularosa TaxID=77115 RepID=UPI0018E1F1A0|nr:parkin coregulated gene protein [Cyprinodon tularosa]
MPRTKDEEKLEGFTVKALNKNSVGEGPPTAGLFQQRPIKPTTFREYYDSRRIPIALDYNRKGHKIKWTVDMDKLDCQQHLPLFFDGLRETEHPYNVLAEQGIFDMLNRGGDKILPVVPMLIMPIRNAMNTKNQTVTSTTLKVLQHMVESVDGMGLALVPHLKYILPAFNLFKYKKSVGNLIEETLRKLEYYGGPEAYKQIKLMVPTYSTVY